MGGLEGDWVDLSDSAVVLHKTALSRRENDSTHQQV